MFIGGFYVGLHLCYVMSVTLGYIGLCWWDASKLNTAIETLDSTSLDRVIAKLNMIIKTD